MFAELPLLDIVTLDPPNSPSEESIIILLHLEIKHQRGMIICLKLQSKYIEEMNSNPGLELPEPMVKEEPQGKF
jgi:hypothetical protein